MQAILDQIADWLKGMLVDGIMNNLEGMFDAVNQQVSDVASQVGNTPQNFSPGVFSMIRRERGQTPLSDHSTLSFHYAVDDDAVRTVENKTGSASLSKTIRLYNPFVLKESKCKASEPEDRRVILYLLQEISAGQAGKKQHHTPCLLSYKHGMMMENGIEENEKIGIYGGLWHGKRFI